MTNFFIISRKLCSYEALYIKKVYIIGRRGPLDSKFTTAEIREMGELLDCDSILSKGTLLKCRLNIDNVYETQNKCGLNISTSSIKILKCEHPNYF